MLHVAWGVALAAFAFPFDTPSRRALRIRRWSARLLRILAVHLTVEGVPPRAGAPAMMVANHVSWLDIFAINAVRPARFVAKSEVRGWPVIGWLCARVGALFIERVRRHHVAQINTCVATALAAGDTFAVFPEGTTTAGDVMLPFHASLLEPALACGTMLHPVAIRYTRGDGSLCREADYAGDKSLLDSLLAMITQPRIEVVLVFLTPLGTAGTHRRALAREAERAIATALRLPWPSKGAGKVADPRAAAR